MGEITAVQPQRVGRGGSSLILPILGCAARQGMVFDLSVLFVLNETGTYVWEKGFSKTTNKQSETNDRNKQIQSNYEG